LGNNIGEDFKLFTTVMKELIKLSSKQASKKASKNPSEAKQS